MLKHIFRRERHNTGKYYSDERYDNKVFSDNYNAEQWGNIIRKTRAIFLEHPKKKKLSSCLNSD